MTILQDFFDYVHSVPLTLLPGASDKGSSVAAAKQAAQTLSIMRGEDVDLKRQAIAINDSARDLILQIKKSDELQIRSYPINLGTFLHNHYNSDFAFIPPKEDYSLMLEGIITHDLQKTPQTVDAVRKFLEALKVRGQEMPKMIEAGDFTPEEMMYDYDYVDGRVALKPKHSRELTQEEYYALQNKQHDRSQAYDVEIQKICDEFEVAFFAGGETRIGHAKNQVQPSNSLCKVKKDGYFLEIESSVNSRTVITKEDVARICEKRNLPKLVIKNSVKEVSDCVINLNLEQVNESCKEDLDLTKVKTMNFSSTLKPDLHFVEDETMKCFAIPRKGLISLFTKALEPALLSGKLHDGNKKPLVIALSTDLSENIPAQEMGKSLEDAKKMIQAFCKEHEVLRPICLAKNPINVFGDPKLESIRGGEVVKCQTEISMAKGLEKVPSKVVEKPNIDESERSRPEILL